MKDFESDMPSEDIIRRISPPHCARGPSRCEKCKEAAQTKMLCLLRVYLAPSQIARPVIYLKKDGMDSYFAFDVMKRFEDENQAIEYAKQHGIVDVDLSEAEL
jgi:hypothetical protein